MTTTLKVDGESDLDGGDELDYLDEETHHGDGFAGTAISVDGREVFPELLVHTVAGVHVGWVYNIEHVAKGGAAFQASVELDRRDDAQGAKLLQQAWDMNDER